MRDRTSWLFGTLILGRLVWGGAALGAAEIPSPRPSDFGAAIDVRVVNVEAVARDSGGRPVQGLKAADFQLTVDGREVPVDYFAEVSNGQEVETRTADASVLPPVKVGTSYLIFIDDAFSIDVQRNRVLDRLAQDLQLGPEDKVAIVAFNGRPKMLTNWTGDIGRVRAVLAEAKKRPVRRYSPVWSGGSEAVAAAASVAMRGTPPQPGHRVFLLVSGGWPELLAHSEIAPEEVSHFVTAVPQEKLFEPVGDTANLLGYTIYFYEIPQVFGALGLDWVGSGWTLPYGSFSLVSVDARLGPYQNLWRLARRTGGGAVLYSTRGDYVERVERDSASFYSLAFSPEWRGDGKRHRIQVKVRKPGVHVQTRDGYFDMTPRMQAMIKAESMLYFGRGTEIQATAGKPRWGGFGAINLPVTLAVPARMLTAHQVAGGYEVKATVRTASWDDWNYAGEHPEARVTQTLTKAPGPNDVVPFTVTLNLNTLGQRISFTVLDDAGAGVGRGGLDYHYKPRKGASG